MVDTEHGSKRVWKTLFYGALLLLALLSFVSVSHLGWFGKSIELSTVAIGILGWLASVWILLFLSLGFVRQSVALFGIFFLFALSYGPFLEPPSDPLEHLRLTHNYYETTTSDLARMNGGLWQYSMSALVIGLPQATDSAERIFTKIDIAHGLFTGLLLTCIFIMAKRVGMPFRWSLFSCILALLFFGTNRFSFFKYYSFAPAFVSMFIYWVWVSLFFFQKESGLRVFQGVIVAALFLPILVVNHLQEAIFLVLALTIWVSLYIHGFVWNKIKNIQILILLYLGILMGVFVFLPQWSAFQEWISNYFIRDLWQWNKIMAVRWGENIHFFGKVWEYRVNDTLGFVGIVTFCLGGPFFWKNWIRKPRDKKIKVFLLAILPFIVYFTPLLNYIWGANVWKQEYYRLCYSSMFWIFLAYFCWSMEGRMLLWYIRTKRLLKKRGKYVCVT